MRRASNARISLRSMVKCLFLAATRIRASSLGVFLNRLLCVFFRQRTSPSKTGGTFASKQPGLIYSDPDDFICIHPGLRTFDACKGFSRGAMGTAVVFGMTIATLSASFSSQSVTFLCSVCLNLGRSLLKPYPWKSRQPRCTPKENRQRSSRASLLNPLFSL
jgi:hypothetical protein